MGRPVLHPRPAADGVPERDEARGAVASTTSSRSVRAVMATTEHAVDLTNEETGHLNMLFQFEHMDLDSDPDSMSAKWALQALGPAGPEAGDDPLAEGSGRQGLEQLLPVQSRPAALRLPLRRRWPYRVESAKMLATFLHMLHGTPYIYQGEEIGMTNVRFASIDDYRDIETLNMYREFVDEKGDRPRHRHGRHPRQEPRQRPHADAVGRQPQCRLHHRDALDRRQPQLPGDQCRRRRWPTPTRSSTTTDN